jgi:hypothetical protein
MNNFSLPRLLIVLWFLNYSIFSIFSYVWGNGRHFIMDFIVYASVWVVIELVFLGLIEDKM